MGPPQVQLRSGRAPFGGLLTFSHRQLYCWNAINSGIYRFLFKGLWRMFMKISYYVNRSLWSLVVMVSLFRTAMPMNQLEEGLSAVSGRHVAGLRYVALAG